MDLFQSLSGMVEAELTSADIPATLVCIADAGIHLHHVRQMDDVTVRILLSRRHYRVMKQIIIRRGESLQLVKKTGAYWWVKAFAKRPILVLGLMSLFIMTLYLPTQIFFVQVEGNVAVPSLRILEAADGCGISFGASRREVRSEQVKNALLQAIPELQWAGVNTYGCLAVISVRERTVVEKKEIPSGVSALVAVRDGIITSCTAAGGNLLCKPGQAVTAGEILISGYTDCGLTIAVSRAEGEVYAQTIRNLTLISPTEYTTKFSLGESTRNFSLLIGKKRINLYKDSGIWGSVCDRIYEEYYVTLPGGFQLPIGLAWDSYTVCETQDTSVEETDALARMQRYAEQYIQQQMIAGTIDSAVNMLTQKPGARCLTGKYICTEMIGKVQWEQIGENHG